MKRTLKSTLTTLVLLAVLVPGAASARKHYHDDEECFVPMTEWQPRAEVLRMASEKGWTVQRVKIDDGCYQIRGSDDQGRRIEVTIHPETLPNGRFARLHDPDGNPVELWEPADAADR